MKQKLLKAMLLLCALIVGGASSVWATDVTFTPGTDTGATSVTKDGVTATMTTMNNASYYQIYANQSGTFSIASGSITKIEFTCTASDKSKYGPGNASANVGSYSYSDKKGTWTGSASSVTISSTAQVRMNSLTITYTAGGGDTPTTYTVTYDDNGATSGDVPEDDNEYEEDDEVTVLGNPGSLAKTGYAFGGWNTQNDGQGTNYTAGGTFTISANTTLYAKWNAYTVTAQSNNNSLGTVSASNYVITALPAEGSRYASPAYTVSGTATVAQDGNTFTVTPSSDCTVTIYFEAIPTHTATFSVNGATTSQDFAEGAAITFPDDPADVNGKTFMGWVTEAIDGTTDDAPDFVTSANMGESNITYYAVFASVGAGSSASLTKMTSSDTFSAGDKVVIVASDNVAMYQATASNTYVNKYTFDNNAETIAADEKNWFTVSAGTNGTWKLGDSTNGYVYNSSSNDLKIDTSNSTDFTLAWNSTEGKFTLKNESRWLSYRSDLSNKYFRMGGTNATPSGTAYFDIYKYSAGGGVSYSGYCTTVAAPVAVTSVSLNAATASVNVGETTTLTATVSPDNATNKNVTWSSSDETVASVDENGFVTGVAAGTATITVTSDADNTKTASCTVTVTTVAVTGVSVDATASVNVGETTTLTATISPSNATNKSVTWSSSDETVASVDENGVVTGVAAGTATITVTSDEDNTQTASCTVTVSAVPGTAARPYTVPEALAVINALTNNGTIDDKYVAGKISQVDSYSSGAITYWISDDGTTTSQLQVYKGKGLNGTSFSAATDLEVGDAVVISGQLKKYVSNNNTTPEFNSGSQLVSRVEKPESDLAKTSDIVLDYLNNNLTADVTEYITSSSTGAYTFTVGDGTIIENADEIISALAIGSTTITVNQAATLSYKAGSVVINVTVQDTRTAASTIPGINISILTEGAAAGTISVVDPVKADEGVTFSFASSDEDVLLIDGTDYVVGKVGTTTVTVTATPSNTNLYKSVVANFDVTIQAAVMSENEITLAASTGSTIYGTPLNVNYTVADGYDGTIGYSIANSAIADVTIGASAITFTPKAVGSTTVTISAPATGNFLAANDVIYTLTVTAPEGGTTAFAAGTAVLDFTQNGWSLPVGSANGLTAENSYTDNGITIKLAATTKYYLSAATNGYLMLGKSGSTLSLPAFDKAVTQIDVEGTAGASESVEQNIYVGETAVSTGTTGAKSVTNKYVINPEYQAAGNIYTLKVTSAHNTQITSITVHFKGITAKLNGSGYATFCSEYPLDFSDYETADYSAWQITGVSGTNILFEQITGSVKGGTGIFLMGEAGETVTLTSTDSENVLTGNKLFGTTAPTFVGANEYYGLKADEFKKVNAGTVPAGKALLPMSADVKSFTFIFETATGVRTVEKVSAAEAEAIFNLAGQRIQKPQRGINIVNGRKVVVK